MTSGVYKRTEKHRKILRGRKYSKETKEKMSKAHIGIIPWNKDLKGYKSLNCFKEGHIPWNKGKGWSEEIKKKLSESHKGQRAWNKGIKTGPNPEHSKRMKGRKLTREHIKKVLRRREKSSLELKFENIINTFNLPYKFVGNGDFFIERKCPDFVNTNGEKIAVEVYYRGHKELFRNGLKEWKENREKIFSKYGWKLLFFNEIQVNESEVIRRIG